MSEVKEHQIEGSKTVGRGPGKRYPLSFKTTFDLRKRLDAAAEYSGRSLAQEVETRLERSFAGAETERALCSISSRLTTLEEKLRAQEYAREDRGASLARERRHVVTLRLSDYDIGALSRVDSDSARYVAKVATWSKQFEEARANGVSLRQMSAHLRRREKYFDDPSPPPGWYIEPRDDIRQRRILVVRKWREQKRVTEEPQPQ